MLNNKNGQFFALYLVFLTLFMCGISIGIYYLQAGATENSFITPEAVLKLNEDYQNLKIQEKGMVLESVQIAEKAGSSGADDIKKIFCELFTYPENVPIKNFLLEGLYNYKGRASWQELAGDVNFQKDFCNNVYSFESQGDKIKIHRNNLEKKFKVANYQGAKINFPISVHYTYNDDFTVP